MFANRCTFITLLRWTFLGSDFGAAMPSSNLIPFTRYPLGYIDLEQQTFKTIDNLRCNSEKKRGQIIR